MSLRLKFNLILAATTIMGLIIAGFISYNLFQKQAREEVLETADIMLESALAVRGYTVSEIRPLLNRIPTDDFLPQTVPAYAAGQYIKRLQQKYPDFSYKEATLNPTNPADRASEWESDIINHYRNHSDAKQVIGERDTPTGPSLYLSRPIRITNPNCLTCHDTPARAPQSLIERYGSTNGFGWKLNEVIGSQIVSVPRSLPLKRADEAFLTFMGAMLGVFLLVAVVLNILLHFFVIKPVGIIAKHADMISMGDTELPELVLSGKDEIASLSRSFNRMKRSLDNAMNMLND